MKVNFTAKGPNLRGKLAACVRFEGSKNRNYKLVKGIRTRDLSTWDQERQMFMAPTEDAMNDSIVVSKMRDDLMKIFEQHHPATAIRAPDLICYKTKFAIWIQYISKLTD